MAGQPMVIENVVFGQRANTYENCDINSQSQWYSYFGISFPITLDWMSMSTNAYIGSYNKKIINFCYGQ